MKNNLKLLVMNGYSIRSLRDLREHYDSRVLLKYARNGELQEWAADRFYEEIVDGLCGIDMYRWDVLFRLDELLGVNKEWNSLYTTEEWEARMNQLRVHIDDTYKLLFVREVAFDQEELADLYDLGCKKVILVDNTFHIPPSMMDIFYTCVGDVTLVLPPMEENSAKSRKSTNLHFPYYGSSESIRYRGKSYRVRSHSFSPESE